MPCFVYEGVRAAEKLYKMQAAQIRLKNKLPTHGLEIDYRRAKRARKAEYNKRLDEIKDDLTKRNESQVIAGLEFVKGQPVKVEKPSLLEEDETPKEDLERYAKLLAMVKNKVLKRLSDEDPRCEEAITAEEAFVLKPLSGVEPPDDDEDDELDIEEEIARREDDAEGVPADGLPPSEETGTEEAGATSGAAGWDRADGEPLPPAKGARREKKPRKRG